MSSHLQREKIQELYNSMAETYDDIDSEAFYADQYAAYERHLERHISHLTGRILDLGCGTGIQSAYLANYAQQVTGLDISDQLLRKAAEKCQKFDNVQFVQADARKIPFEDGSFDGVISYGETLSHIPDVQIAFLEVQRVLRPNGLFLFSVVNKWYIGLLYSPQELIQALTSKSGPYRIWTCQDDIGNPTVLPVKTFSRKEIHNVASSAGFIIEEAEAIHLTSSLVPFRWQGHKHTFWDNLYRYLGQLDVNFAKRPLLANFGFSCIYTAQRR